MRFTPEQQAVIAAEPANLLVSAAAGSGKTAVLTERIVARVIARQLDVQQVLVVTFTEAAARQMREKIEAKLLAARQSAQDADLRRHLGRQLALLPTAAISTIHAFCLRVIRDFYPLARDGQGQLLFEPGFSVQDSFEASLLLRQVLDEWLDSQYEAIDQLEGQEASVRADSVMAFYRLTDGFGDSRSDQPVRDLILQIYRYLRSLPDYQVFAREKLQEAARAAADFSASRYCRTLLDQLRLRMDRAMAVLPDVLEMLAGPVRLLADQRRNQAMRAQLQAGLAVLPDLQRLLNQEQVDWDAIRMLAQPLAQLELPRASGRDPDDKRAFLQLFEQHVAEAVCFLTGNCGTAKYARHFLFQTVCVFDKPAAAIQAEIQEMLPAMTCFIQLLDGLDERYARQKRQAGVIDFSDFEHLALLILRQDEARHYYQNRYQEIYIDEYQDTSSIQEAILLAISQDRTLMVGDIKQSIYRFRHARPQIFRAKADAYARGDDGRLLTLSRNFRSVPGLLSAVNDLFVQLMSPGSAEITYDRQHGLVPDRKAADTAAFPVQVLLLDQQAETPDSGASDGEDDQDAAAETLLRPGEMSLYEKEALLVLAELTRLHEAGFAWRDMVILARTHGMLSAYREQLEGAGIPTAADAAAEIMDIPALRLLEAMLLLLDNRHQDIPLAAVMNSDMGPVSFTLDELVMLRLFGRERQLKAFHKAVFAYAEAGDEATLRHKTSRFLSWVDGLREKEQVLRVGELIGLLLSENGWLERVAAAPGGERHVRLLRQFQSWAEQYEQNKIKGLHLFARYLERLREDARAADPVAEPASGDADRVRLITIHGSKGLEFPVVFLVGTHGRLRAGDMKEHVLFSENLGIGFDYADPARQIRYPTHLKLAMQEEMRAAGLAEEMRLLYVAMTRAMDRLYLVGTLSLDPVKGAARLGQAVAQARQCRTRRLPDHLVLSVDSYLAWILLALARNPRIDLSFLEGAAADAAISLPSPARCRQDEAWMPEDDSCAAMPGMNQPSPHWLVSCRPLGSVQTEAERLRRRQAASGQDEAAGPAIAQSPTNAAAGCVQKPDVPDEMARRIIAPYRFATAARTPAKLTVSELKRRLPADDPDEPAAFSAPWQQLVSQQGNLLPYRGIDLTLHGLADMAQNRSAGMHSAAGPADSLSGTRLGLALHAAFRYLDLPAARERPDLAEINRQLAAMQAGGMLAPDEYTAVRSMNAALLRFIRSDLAAEMAAAGLRGDLMQEMPFTLALPACQVYKDCAGLAEDDQVMVQGIIDCWFRDLAGITLIDYKSDQIAGDTANLAATLKQRYAEQLRWYALAISTVTGCRPRRCLIWHIRSGQAFPVATDGTM